jgi:hypothetical protein
VLRVRAAGKEKRVVTVAGMNLTLDSLGVGIGQSVGFQAVKAIGKIEATASTVEKNVNGRELGAAPHRLRILVNDILGGSGRSLLDGRIDPDRIEPNVQLPFHFGIAGYIHGQNSFGRCRYCLLKSRSGQLDSDRQP